MGEERERDGCVCERERVGNGREGREIERVGDGRECESVRESRGWGRE